jgi:hypothetical protein
MTPPPKSASSNPCSASLTALHRLASSIPDFLAKRVKALFLNIRTLSLAIHFVFIYRQFITLSTIDYN